MSLKQQCLELKKSFQNSVLALFKGKNIKVIQKPYERTKASKLKAIVAIMEEEEAERIKEKIKYMEEELNENLREICGTNVLYPIHLNVNIRRVLTGDILYSVSRAYKQLRLKGDVAVNDAIKFLTQNKDKMEYDDDIYKEILYNQRIDELKVLYNNGIISKDKEYFYTLSTGSSYRITYLSSETQRREQKPVGDITILCGISSFNLKENNQRRRADRITADDCLFFTDLLHIREINEEGEKK